MIKQMSSEQFLPLAITFAKSQPSMRTRYTSRQGSLPLQQSRYFTNSTEIVSRLCNSFVTPFLLPLP